MSTGEWAVAVLYGGEGKYRSVAARWYIHLQSQVPKEGRRASQLHSSKEYGTLYICLYYINHAQSEYKHLRTFRMRRYVVIATKPVHRL